MKLVEAFKNMKKIITNGINKGYTVCAVKNSIDSYIDILVDDGDLSNKDAEILKTVQKELSSIMSEDKTADEVFIDALEENEKPKEKTKTVHETSSPVIVECGGSRVQRDRCGNIVTGRCGSPVYESSSSRCGSSSSSSCGSSRISRC